MARIAAGFLGSILSSLIASPMVHAYVQMRADNGAPLEWARSSETGSFRTHYALIPNNRSGLTAQTVKAAVVRSLERWMEAGLGNFLFDVWTGSDSSVYRAGTSFDGYSKVYFLSQGGSGSASSSVIGYTQVWHDSQTGRIIESDVELNDVHFAFTTRAGDSSGTGNGQLSRVNSEGKRTVFIENVLTHELGHSLGLGHSGAMQAAMLPFEAPSQFRLSCDDRIAIQAAYPTSSTVRGRGTLGGQVIAESGQAVVGAHVSLVSRRRGVVLASTLTDGGGRFVVEALEPGDYTAVVEPYGGGAGSVPSYYGAMNPRVCPSGASFVRSFQTVSDTAQGALRFTTVSAGRSHDLGRLVARCLAPAESSERAALRSGEGLVLAGDSRDIEVQHAGGTFEFKLLSHTLYYNRFAAVDLLDATGRPVAIEVSQPSFVSESGFRNYDVHARVADLAAGNYLVRVRMSYLASTWIPGASMGQVALPVFAVMALSAESSPVVAGELPWNARCEAADVDTRYVSPAGIPPKSDGSAGGCGTIRKVGGGASGGAGSTSVDWRAAASWLLSIGWFIPVLALRRLRFRVSAVSLRRV